VSACGSDADLNNYELLIKGEATGIEIGELFREEEDFIQLKYGGVVYDTRWGEAWVNEDKHEVQFRHLYFRPGDTGEEEVCWFYVLRLDEERKTANLHEVIYEDYVLEDWATFTSINDLATIVSILQSYYED
jgi:hypothetical protein